MFLWLCFSGYVPLGLLLLLRSSGYAPLIMFLWLRPSSYVALVLCRSRYVLRSKLKVSGVLCCYVPLVIFLWLCASDNAPLVLLLLLGSSGYMLHCLCSSGYVPLFLRPLLPQSFSLLVSSSLRPLVP